MCHVLKKFSMTEAQIRLKISLQILSNARAKTKKFQWIRMGFDKKTNGKSLREVRLSYLNSIKWYLFIVILGDLSWLHGSTAVDYHKCNGPFVIGQKVRTPGYYGLFIINAISLWWFQRIIGLTFANATSLSHVRRTPSAYTTCCAPIVFLRLEILLISPLDF